MLSDFIAALLLNNPPTDLLFTVAAAINVFDCDGRIREMKSPEQTRLARQLPHCNVIVLSAAVLYGLVAGE